MSQYSTAGLHDLTAAFRAALDCCVFGLCGDVTCGQKDEYFVAIAAPCAAKML
jgi:hypothetical protein